MDGALDVLRVPANAPVVESLAPPVPFFKQLHVSAAVGAGIEQGVFSFVPALAVEGAVRYRYLELSLDVDVGLASQTSFTNPPAGGDALGNVLVNPRLGGARARAGPSARAGTGRREHGFRALRHRGVHELRRDLQQHTQTATEPFFALRLGYALNLPRGLFVAVRAEERITRTATFDIEGAEFPPPFGQTGVTTPVWTFQSLAFVGYHFS